MTGSRGEDDPLFGVKTDVPAQQRLIDRLDPRLVNILTALGFGLPVVGYFWLITHFSVNTIVGDQWDNVTVIGHSYSHLFDWGSLWAQHNENRIFFPNLIVVLMSRTTNFNIQVEELFSAMMLIVAVALFIWAHKRRAPSTPWLYYCPVVILMFSIVQFENTLWGFQLAWYLVLVSLATAIVLLDRVNLTWLILVAAIAAAVVGSFSSLQGLFIWPAGLVLFYHRRRRVGFAAVWLAAGLVSVAVYFHHFDSNSGAAPHSYALQHPVESVKFFLFALGDIAGPRLTFGSHGNLAVLLFGLVILILAVIALVAYGIRRDEHGGSPVGVALIIVGLLFAASITEGRIIFGYWGASASRYTTFDLLVPVGIYLTLLGRPTFGTARRRAVAEVSTGAPPGARRVLTRLDLPGWLARTAVPVARGAIIVAIALQLALGVHYGLQGARSSNVYQVESVRVIRHLDTTPVREAVYFLYPFKTISFLRTETKTLRTHHLSLYSGTPGP